MNSIALLLSVSLLLLGCGKCDPHLDTVGETQISGACPHFNAILSIQIKELNATHASISWKDVNKIEWFLEKKKTFNSGIDTINK